MCVSLLLVAWARTLRLRLLDATRHPRTQLRFPLPRHTEPFRRAARRSFRRAECRRRACRSTSAPRTRGHRRCAASPTAPWRTRSCQSESALPCSTSSASGRKSSRSDARICLEQRVVLRRGGVEAVRAVGVVRVAMVGARDERDTAGKRRDRLAELDVLLERPVARGRDDDDLRRRGRTRAGSRLPSRAGTPPSPRRCRRTRRRGSAGRRRAAPLRLRCRSRAPPLSRSSRRRSGARRGRSAA